MMNREKLSKMALIDVLMYLDVCTTHVGYTVKRCFVYDGDCYRCRMDWLNEPAKGSEDDENNS